MSYKKGDNQKHTFHSRLIPFGVGKRKCISENVTRMILKSLLFKKKVVSMKISVDEGIRINCEHCQRNFNALQTYEMILLEKVDLSHFDSFFMYFETF